MRISHVCKFAIAMLAVALFASPLLYANSTHSGESGRFALITGGFSAYGITDLLPKGELTGKAGVPHPSAAFFGFGESRGVWGSNLAWGAAFESDRNFSHVDFGNPGHHRGTFFPPLQELMHRCIGADHSRKVSDQDKIPEVQEQNLFQSSPISR